MIKTIRRVNLVGEFLQYYLQWNGDHTVPENLKALYVDNDEMYYVMRRKQYLFDAKALYESDPFEISNTGIAEIALLEAQEPLDDHAQLTAYARGITVIATLVKIDEGRWLIEDFAEHSGEYDGMKEDYQIFCRKEEQNGITEPRELIDLYFSNRLSELKEIEKLRQEAIKKATE